MKRASRGSWGSALIRSPLQGDSLEVVARGSVIAKGDSLRTIPIPDQDISSKVRMSEPLVLVLVSEN